MKRRLQILLLWGPPIGWATLIFISSSLPVRLEERPFPIPIDKLAHIGVYAILCALLLRALLQSTALRPTAACLLAVLLTSLYGASDEFHQSFVPLREADLFDWLADTVGALMAVAAYGLWKVRRSLSR